MLEVCWCRPLNGCRGIVWHYDRKDSWHPCRFGKRNIFTGRICGAHQRWALASFGLGLWLAEAHDQLNLVVLFFFHSGRKDLWWIIDSCIISIYYRHNLPSSQGSLCQKGFDTQLRRLMTVSFVWCATYTRSQQLQVLENSSAWWARHVNQALSGDTITIGFTLDQVTVIFIGSLTWWFGRGLGILPFPFTVIFLVKPIW